MKKALGTAVISAGLLFNTAAPALAYQHYYRQYDYQQHKYVEHRRHMETAKRVGIGAAGGAVAGGLIGGGGGAVVGGLAGAGGGYIWDRHQKHHGHY